MKILNDLDRINNINKMPFPLRSLSHEFLNEATHDWGWTLAAGILYIILGLFLLQIPIMATLTLSYTLGIVFLISGIAQFIQFVRWRRASGSGATLFQAIVSLLAGALMMRYPTMGAIGLTFTLVFYLLVGAAGKWMTASLIHPHRGSGILFFNSILSFALGIIVLMGMPNSASITPGLFLAIDLFFTGVTCVALALSMKKLHKELDLTTKTETPRKAA